MAEFYPQCRSESGLLMVGSKIWSTLFELLESIQAVNYVELEMWANAQPDGRPAEYRWRPLFNAAKFG